MRIKPLAVSLCLLGLISPSILAQSDDAQVIQKLTEREQVLEREVHDLQAELKALETPRPRQPSKVIVIHARRPARSAPQPNGAAVPAATENPYHEFTVPDEDDTRVKPKGPPMLELPVAASPTELAPLSLLVNAPMTIGGMPVVTSPYLGIRSEFDASDLVSNFPNVQLPFRLLQQRQKIEKVFCDNHIPYPDQPFIDLSGTVQPIIFVAKPYRGPTQSGIDLPTASLDAMANINKWVMTFVRFTFDNNAPGNFIPPGIGPVVANSRIFLDQGFLSIGALNHLPLYLTMGQIYVPFGKYSSNMISSTLPQLLFRTKARAVELGYYKDWKHCSIEQSILLQGFFFRGDARISVNSSRINNGGGNIDYTITTPKWNLLIGASAISNVADALNMQVTGNADGFGGFAGPNALFLNPEVLQHRVPGVDVHASLGIGPFGFLGEYTTATTDFSVEDLTFNDHGARPQASYLEGVYNFNICKLPANIAVGYQQSRQALAFLIPKQRVLATFNISLWKDTVESLEVRRDWGYATHDVATGRGFFVDTGDTLGRNSTMVTLQVAAYF